MTINRERRQGRVLMDFWKAGAGFVVMGGFLFFVVWWPIQAERTAVQLKRIELLIAQKKSDLNTVNSRYAVMTSLSSLDSWAKKHGPWKTPSANDVIAIE